MTAKIKLNADSGGGSVSIQAPSSSSNNRVISLPDIADGTLVTSQSTLDATKLSGNLPALNGSALTNLPSSGGGKILQVVSTTKTDIFSQSTSSNTAFYDITNLSATITPNTSGNKILIFISLALGANQTTQRMGVKTVVSIGGGANTDVGVSTDTGTAQDVSMGSLEMHRIYHNIPVSYNYLFTTSSTSSHLFRPQIAMEASGTGTMYINRSEIINGDSAFTSVSTITLMEVAQ